MRVRFPSPALEFSPARPPGLGGGHCALGLANAAAHEPCGGSPVQRYKGESPGEPSVLVASERFRSRTFVGGEQSSWLEQFNRRAHAVGTAL